MKTNVLRGGYVFLTSLLCFVFQPYASGWDGCLNRPPEIKTDEFVMAVGGRLMSGENFLSAVCVPLDALLKGDIPEDAAEARALAEKLAGCAAAAGVGIVKVDSIPPLTSYTAHNDAECVFYDAFLSACRRSSVRIWADVIRPNMFPALPVDSIRFADQSTDALWREAVSSAAPGADVMLARAWDPRLEIVISSRVHEWGRAFNPESGKMRCEDPVFAVWGFESDWFDRMWNSDWVMLPEFFRKSFLEEWNRWLADYVSSPESKYRDTGAFLTDSEDPHAGTAMFLSGRFCEKAEAAGIYVPLPDAAEAAKNPIRIELQKEFLEHLYSSHMRRIQRKFSLLGAATLRVPMITSFMADGTSCGDLSDIVFLVDAGAGEDKPSVALLDCGEGVPDREFVALRAAAVRENGGDIAVITGIDPDSERTLVLSAAAAMSGCPVRTGNGRESPRGAAGKERRTTEVGCLTIADGAAFAGPVLGMSVSVPARSDGSNTNQSAFSAAASADMESIKMLLGGSSTNLVTGVYDLEAEDRIPETDMASSVNCAGMFPVKVVLIISSDTSNGDEGASVKVFVKPYGGGQLPLMKFSAAWIKGGMKISTVNTDGQSGVFNGFVLVRGTGRSFSFEVGLKNRKIGGARVL